MNKQIKNELKLNDLCFKNERSLSDDLCLMQSSIRLLSLSFFLQINKKHIKYRTEILVKFYTQPSLIITTRTSFPCHQLLSNLDSWRYA